MSVPGTRVLRDAEVIAVGSELLGWTRLDTNSLFIAQRLAEVGIVLRAKSVVGDDRERLSTVFSQALARADLVVLTGGLGPTDDDLTRDAVADALGVPLEEDPAIAARIEERFARRGLRMPDINRRQAMVLRGAAVLANPNGTAPGQYLEHDGKAITLLPGPPREMQPMLEDLLSRVIATRTGPERILRASIFVAGRTESHVEEAVQPIYAPWRTADPPIETTILAAPGQIELHLMMRALPAADARQTLSMAQQRMVDALGADAFSTDGRSMEQVVGDLLRDRGLTIACAESCTGGLLLSRLTEVPGSSAYVLGGAVVYSNDLKIMLADVPGELIAEHGAVSEPVAVALAEGVRTRTGADVTVGITGVAGPGGGSPGKPVGTVAIAVAGPHGAARVRTWQFPGGRPQVRFHATQAALDLVRRLLLDQSS